MFSGKTFDQIKDVISSYDGSLYFSNLWLLCFTLNQEFGNFKFEKLYKDCNITHFIPGFKDIHLIQQDKQNGTNLLTHIISVYESVDPVMFYFKKRGFDPWENCEFPISRKDSRSCFLFTAFFHDIGKVIDVETHPRHSYKISKSFIENCELFLNITSFATIVLRMILLHMRPLGYQRGENWSDKAIGKFIRDCSGKDVAILTTMFSAMDKYGSTKNFFYLDRLVELCNRISDYECV